MIRLRQIKVAVPMDQTLMLRKKVGQLLKVPEDKISSLTIVKQSLDARKKEHLFYVYEVDVEVPNEASILARCKSKDIFLAPTQKYQVPSHGTQFLKDRPIVVGSGPAGLFAAYLLAQEGYHPLVVERGDAMEERVKTVEQFWETGVLKEESNVQFGEGGAGTFSDGKLNTMVKDSKCRGQKVFDIFVAHGAPEEIRYLQKPHIGTDLLRNVIIQLRKSIIAMGGTFRYQCKLTDLVIQDNRLQKIIVNGGEEIPCSVLVLAIGHSARDTFEMLVQKNLAMTSKPFAVGLRIVHPQKMIDEAQYGKEDVLLGPASYKLTYTTTQNRGVYSFCMCPGGYVVNASSEPGRLAINGMSNHRRDTGNANSAIVVTVDSKDFGPSILSGMYFQRKLEERAYQLGNGKIPVQLVGDFLKKVSSSSYGKVSPLTKGATSFADLNDLLPSYVREALHEAIPYFGKKITGFDRPDALLMGIESRTSSPVRILRDDTLQASISGIYPCGEGAGYAGGITTACMDGLRVAEEIIKQYL